MIRRKYRPEQVEWGMPQGRLTSGSHMCVSFTTQISSQHVLGTVSQATHPHPNSSTSSLNPHCSSSKGTRQILLSTKIDTYCKMMRRVSGLNSLLSLIASLMGFLVIQSEKDLSPSNSNLWLKTGIALVSLVQIWLIIIYWKGRFRLDWYKGMAFRGSSGLYFRFRKSPRAVFLCLIECGFHLIILCPQNLSAGVSEERPYAALTLNDLCYWVILARNYHFLQFVYWSTDVSAARSVFLGWLLGLNMTPLFALKSLLSRGHTPILSLLFLSASLLLSLISSLLSPPFSLNSIWDTAYMTIIAGTTLGIPVDMRLNLGGKVAAAIAPVLGIGFIGLATGTLATDLRLSAKERRFSRALLYATLRRSRYGEAARAIQAWWRLISMRKRAEIDLYTVFSYYSAAKTHKMAISACQRCDFASQIDDFSHKLQTALPASVQLTVRTATYQSVCLAQKSLRNQYRILTSLRRLCKSMRVSHKGRKTYVRLNTILEVNSDAASSSAISPIGHERRVGDTFDHAADVIVKE